MSTTLLILEGDGIGPEISAATVKVLTVVDELPSRDLSFESAGIDLN